VIAWLRNLVGLLVSLAIAYGGVYFVFRLSNTQVRGEDPVVVFGSRASYLFFRPAAYVDGAVTGMHFHLGAYRVQ